MDGLLVVGVLELQRPAGPVEMGVVVQVVLLQQMHPLELMQLVVEVEAVVVLRLVVLVVPVS